MQPAAGGGAASAALILRGLRSRSVRGTRTAVVKGADQAPPAATRAAGAGAGEPRRMMYTVMSCASEPAREAQHRRARRVRLAASSGGASAGHCPPPLLCVAAASLGAAGMLRGGGLAHVMHAATPAPPPAGRARTTSAAAAAILPAIMRAVALEATPGAAAPSTEARLQPGGPGCVADGAFVACVQDASTHADAVHGALGTCVTHELCGAMCCVQAWPKHGVVTTLPSTQDALITEPA